MFGILIAATVSAMLGFGTFIMQVDLFEQINALAATVSIFISTISGIVIYAITTYRKVTKGQLSERDKWIMEAMKGTQLTAQKAAEGIGRSKEVMQIIYEANVPEVERRKIEAKLMPLLQETDESLKAANEQAAMAKAKAVEIFGESGDVDLDKSLPRESKAISERLRHASPHTAGRTNTNTNNSDAI